jgi:hypothetical protein
VYFFTIKKHAEPREKANMGRSFFISLKMVGITPRKSLKIPEKGDVLRGKNALPLSRKTELKK